MASCGTVAEIGIRREKKVTKMLVLMVFAFNLSWSPYAFMCIMDILQLQIISPIWKIAVLILSKRYLFKDNKNIGAIKAHINSTIKKQSFLILIF